MDEEILKWYGKHINESGGYDVWIGDKDAFYRAAYNKAIEDAAQTANEAYCTNHVLLSIRALEMK